MTRMCSAIMISAVAQSLFATRGVREPEHASLADLPAPHTPPLQGLSPHILCPVHLLQFPLERGVTLTLGVTSCISYNNNQLHPQHRAKPNSRCHLESTLQSLPSQGWKSHPPHVECLYLPCPSSVHCLSLWDCRKASAEATPPLQDFY